MRIQVNEPVTIGAGGGTHGLFALCYARNMYISSGKPLRGVWLEADMKIKRYIEEARTLQNRDGSFSSNHFQGPGYSPDFTKRIATSGHQLEWLMVAVPQSKLKDEWLQNGIKRIAYDLIDHRNVGSDCGPLYHALHGLIIYRQRTVPQYLVPKMNSELKLTERGKKPDQVAPTISADDKKSIAEKAKSTTTITPKVAKVIPEPKEKTEKAPEAEAAVPAPAEQEEKKD